MSQSTESKRSASATASGASESVAGPPLSAGLWIVSTPIGNISDITLRAVDVLQRCDVLVCEDTRQTRKLLDLHGISLGGRVMLSYNDQNGPRQRPKVLGHLKDGKSVAYVSDAGTPLIADPGYRLVSDARVAGHSVHIAPGVSAVVAALTLAGLPTDRFLFLGFPPNKSAARKALFQEFLSVNATLVFYESARRTMAFIGDLEKVSDGTRQVSIVREITKVYEEVISGTVEDVQHILNERTDLKGEIVIVIGPPESGSGVATAEQLDAMLLDALENMSVRDAAASVAIATGMPRKQCYGRALELQKR